MNQLICNACGHKYTTDEAIKQPYSPSAPHITVNRCPKCGSTESYQEPTKRVSKLKQGETYFKVLSLEDKRSERSELMVGNTYIGELSANNQKVFYTDRTDDIWVFYVGDTCELISEF